MCGLASIIVAYLIYWKCEYVVHATPDKAQALVSPSVEPFATVDFAKGKVLLTPSAQGNSFTAWYMTKNTWGWHVTGISQAVTGLAPQNYSVDFEAFSFNGETFVWGTTMTPITRIIYHHDGKTFTTQPGKYPVWYMILPFEQHLFPHSEWTMVLPDGKTEPLFKN